MLERLLGLLEAARNALQDQQFIDTIQVMINFTPLSVERVGDFMG